MTDSLKSAHQFKGGSWTNSDPGWVNLIRAARLLAQMNLHDLGFRTSLAGRRPR